MLPMLSAVAWACAIRSVGSTPRCCDALPISYDKRRGSTLAYCIACTLPVYAALASCPWAPCTLPYCTAQYEKHVQRRYLFGTLWALALRFHPPFLALLLIGIPAIFQPYARCSRHICAGTRATSAPGLAPHLHRDSRHICAGTRATSAHGVHRCPRYVCRPDYREYLRLPDRAHFLPWATAWHCCLLARTCALLTATPPSATRRSASRCCRSYRHKYARSQLEAEQPKPY
jgi:hypothetical protein